MKFTNVFFNNAQNIIRIDDDLKYIIKFCCKLVLNLEKFYKKAEVSVLFTDDAYIKKLNYKYKNKDCPTDVLSFPTKDFGDYFCYDEETVVLGDIVISTQTALKQFKVYGSSCFAEEIARLIIHGMLHLLGYDHEKGFLCCKIMENKEKILNKIVKYKFKFERVKEYEK